MITCSLQVSDSRKASTPNLPDAFEFRLFKPNPPYLKAYCNMHCVGGGVFLQLSPSHVGKLFFPRLQNLLLPISGHPRAVWGKVALALSRLRVRRFLLPYDPHTRLQSRAPKIYKGPKQLCFSGRHNFFSCFQ